MPKELFNQTLITSPTEPDDNDRIAFGQPSVSGGKNILWSYLKQIIQAIATTFDKVVFNTGLANPAHQEGALFYDDTKKALSYYNDVSDVTIWLNQGTHFIVINQTGVLVPKGSVICPDSTTIIALADASDKSKSSLLAVTMHDIADGSVGYAAKLGQIEGLNTASFLPGKILYLSDTTPGAFTDQRPVDGNYPSIIGVVDVQDASAGIITVDTVGFNGTDTEVNIDGILNGIVVDTPDVIISSDGVTITATVNNESDPGNPLRFLLDGERYFLPEGNSVTVPPGADASTLQSSILYIYLNVGVPTLAIATTAPSIPYCSLGELAVFNAVRTQSDGRPFAYRRSNNAINYLNGVNDGALGLNIRILNAIRKKLGSNWISGQDGTPTVNNTTIRLAMTAGRAMQLNEFSVPLFDGLSYIIYNDTSNTVTYASSINLTDITADANGNTLLANNTFYTIRLFYLLNSNGVGNSVIATRPLGKYTTSAEAINDPNNLTVNVNDTTIEEIIYPLYDLVISRTGAGGTTITLVQLTDLRSKIAGGFGGGGASGGGGTDDKVRISATDTTNDYLNPKFTPGDEFTKEITNPAANETLTLKFKGWIYNAARTFKAILSAASLTADRTFTFPDKDGTFAMLSDIGGGGPASQVEQGTAYTFLGELLNDSFPGTTLNATNWSGGLPTGASVNNGLIIASGSAAWDRYITLANLYPYEKEDIIIDMVATTKNSGDAWGITMNNIVFITYKEDYYWKFNQFTGVLSLGTTTAANEIGSMQPVTFNAGDNLIFTFKRKPGKTIVVIENVTQSLKFLGEFPVTKWGTEGYYRLAFLGGQQTFNNVTIDSTERDFGTNTDGVVILGDSITYGEGASSIADRWTNVLFKGQDHLFVNLGFNSWESGYVTGAVLTDLLKNIDAKYLICNLGYNDQSRSVATGTYQTNLETIATTAQGLGYTVIFVSPFPRITGSNAAYVTAMQTAATNTSSIFVDMTSDLGNLVDRNLIADGVHPNDSGHLAISESIELQSNEIFEDILADINNEDLQARSIGYSNNIVPLIGLDFKGRFVKLNPSNYVNKNSLLLQGSLDGNNIIYQLQTGNVGFDGKLFNTNSYQQLNATAQGLKIGFNNGVNDTVCSNINITNKGTNGIGSVQDYHSLTGLRNIVIHGDTVKGSMGYGISGDDNLFLNPERGANGQDIQGDYNLAIQGDINAITTAQLNIFIGKEAGKNIATGRNNIILSHLHSYNGISVNYPTAATGVIAIGTFSDFNGFEDFDNGEVCIASYARNIARKYTFGPKGGLMGSAEITWRAGISKGTDINGVNLNINGHSGTGSGNSGSIVFNIGTPGTTGTTGQTFNQQLSINDGNVKVENVFKAGQFTAAEASALTPANGDFIYVTSTDATFTSVGFWGYENGTWTKL